MRKKIFILLVLIAAVSVAGWQWLDSKYTVPVIMYHRVNPSGTERGDTVSPERFRQQMEFLRKYNYQVIPLEELVRGIKDGKRFPRNTVVITFDDGYEDNFTHALPILQEYRYPSTLFICPDFIGKVREGHAFLSWEQLEIMKNAGMSLQSHTMTHAYLPDLDLDDARYEIEESKRILEEELNVPIEYFAYPIGGFTPDTKELIKKAGYKAAFTTNRGHDRFDKDIYEINRIRFSNNDHSQLYTWAKLSGYNNLFRKLKRPY